VRSAQESRVAAAQQRLLGWGLASEPVDPGADIGRDLVLTSTAGGRGLAVVSGVPNLVQALETALTTALGDDVFNTAFGFDGVRMLASGLDPALTREGLRVAVIDVLRRDPRVRRIVEVSLDSSGTSGDRSRRTATVRAVCETVAGDSVALAARGMVPGV
jgi:phage baseplate assembly protein W